jgi:hypothetical protein
MSESKRLRVPGKLDGCSPKMAHVRVQRLTTGNSKEHAPQDNSRLYAVGEQIPQTNHRIKRRQDGRLPQYLDKPINLSRGGAVPQTFLKRVERAGSDITEHDTQRDKRQRK